MAEGDHRSTWMQIVRGSEGKPNKNLPVEGRKMETVEKGVKYTQR